MNEILLEEIPIDKIQREIFNTKMAAKSLVVYRQVLGDSIVKKFMQFLGGVLKEIPVMTFTSTYHEFFNSLIIKAETTNIPTVGDLWQDHILDLLLMDENPFSLRCEKIGIDELDQPLIELTRRDLTVLQKLYNFDFLRIIHYVEQKVGKFHVDFPTMYARKTEAPLPHPRTYFKQRQYIKVLLSKTSSWSKSIRDLAKFHHTCGCGKFARYWAFKWVDTTKGGRLVGIPNPDPIRFRDLIGYEEQKNEVLRNTRQFIQGIGANNMLLYGDRGTGKSSTIKALVHEFGEMGLRIVEVTKEQLISLGDIITELGNRPYRFIIFVDDLSFEEHEVEYKYLKAVLEGSLESAPDNVRIYATSNRRHLIREFHSDRVTDEVKSQDTLQEKLSLSDRFGITVIYPSPDQEEYLEIVQGIAKSKGIDIEPEQLRQMALKWELWHNRRSGRTAKQFIDDLIGAKHLSY